jgi:hypothetical protein
MSEFGKTIEQSEKRTTTRPKFGSDFIRISSEHETTLRILDEKPEVSWSHFVPKGHHAFPQANAGKGMSFICPGFQVCPICKWNQEQRKKDPKTKDVLNTRMVYTFNVLDRTPIVVCPSCEAQHYKIDGSYPAECECGADLKDVESTPKNKFQIMQKGKRIMDQIKALEADPDFGDLRGYDLKLTTRGKGSESMTSCVPKKKEKLDLKAVFGEDWEAKKYNVKDVVSPLPADAVGRILNGEDYYSVLGAGRREQ